MSCSEYTVYCYPVLVVLYMSSFIIINICIIVCWRETTCVNLYTYIHICIYMYYKIMIIKHLKLLHSFDVSAPSVATTIITVIFSSSHSASENVSAGFRLPSVCCCVHYRNDMNRKINKLIILHIYIYSIYITCKTHPVGCLLQHDRLPHSGCRNYAI